jgi:hypothetical protein
LYVLKASLQAKIHIFFQEFWPRNWDHPKVGPDG